MKPAAGPTQPVKSTMSFQRPMPVGATSCYPYSRGFCGGTRAVVGRPRRHHRPL
jgi:hypothetical protein